RNYQQFRVQNFLKTDASLQNVQRKGFLMTETTDTATPWITDWDLDRPLKLKGANAPLLGAEWGPGAVPYFEHRHLNLDKASDGKFGGSYVRAIATSGDWQADDVDFNQYYVTSGTATIEFQNGSTHKLVEDTSVIIPALYGYRFSIISEDFTALHFVAPAE